MFREKIKDFLAAQGMIKGHSGSGTRSSDQEGMLVLVTDHGRSDTSSPHSPALSVDSSDDRRRSHTLSSVRLVISTRHLQTNLPYQQHSSSDLLCIIFLPSHSARYSAVPLSSCVTLLKSSLAMSIGWYIARDNARLPIKDFYGTTTDRLAAPPGAPIPPSVPRKPLTAAGDPWERIMVNTVANPDEHLSRPRAPSRHLRTCWGGRPAGYYTGGGERDWRSARCSTARSLCASRGWPSIGLAGCTSRARDSVIRTMIGSSRLPPKPSTVFHLLSRGRACQGGSCRDGCELVTCMWHLVL